MCKIDTTLARPACDTRSARALGAVMTARADMQRILVAVTALTAAAGVPTPTPLDRAAEGLYDGTMALTLSTLDDLAATIRAAVAYYDDAAKALEVEEGSSC